MVRISYIKSDYYDVCFAVDYGNMLSWEFYSDNSQKQQFMCRHVPSLRHIVLNLSQPVLATCLFFLMQHASRRSNKYQLYSLCFDLTSVWSTAIEASKLTLTPQMWLSDFGVGRVSWKLIAYGLFLINFQWST